MVDHPVKAITDIGKSIARKSCDEIDHDFNPALLKETDPFEESRSMKGPVDVSEGGSIHTLETNFQPYETGPGHPLGHVLIHGFCINFCIETETPIRIVNGQAFEQGLDVWSPRKTGVEKDNLLEALVPCAFDLLKIRFSGKVLRRGDCLW
jgi:hypothetical protein